MVFVRASQSANLKGILETVWGKIVGRKRLKFKDVEDAHIEMQQLNLSQSKPILIILDDVFSRNNLEKVII